MKGSAFKFTGCLPVRLTGRHAGPTRTLSDSRLPGLQTENPASTCQWAGSGAAAHWQVRRVLPVTPGHGEPEGPRRAQRPPLTRGTVTERLGRSDSDGLTDSEARCWAFKKLTNTQHLP